MPFGVPFRPTPFRVTFHVKAGDVEVAKEVPVQFRYVKDILHGRQADGIERGARVFREGHAAAGRDSARACGEAVQREIHVTVTNGTKGAAQASVALELPAGWKATPASVPLSFAMRTNRFRRVSR